MGLSIDQLRHAFNMDPTREKPILDDDINTTGWNIIVEYYIDTRFYDPTSNGYSKGLELFHTDFIPLCAHLHTESYFSEIIVEDDIINVAEECQLDKVEPGYYKCVCAVKIEDVTSSSWEGVTEYDTETYYEMLSRTKLSNDDMDYIIEENKVYINEEEYAELMSNTV